MKILIIDGQGGKVGGQLVAAIRQRFPEADVTAVGTNAIATACMLKSGARRAATGENAVAVACRRADAIIGPMGIVLADALYGEVTPAMAAAVARSDAARILIPFSQCDTLVAGLPALPLPALVEDALAKLQILAEGGLCEK